MKLPEEIQGKNRIRDFNICRLYIEGKTPPEIVEQGKLKITVRRVNQILYDHADFLNSRIAWPKSRRIHYLQKWIGERPKSRKDAADLMEQLRKELEGDRPLIDQSEHKTFVIQKTYVKSDVESETNERLRHARQTRD